MRDVPVFRSSVPFPRGSCAVWRWCIQGQASFLLQFCHWPVGTQITLADQTTNCIKYLDRFFKYLMLQHRHCIVLKGVNQQQMIAWIDLDLQVQSASGRARPSWHLLKIRRRNEFALGNDETRGGGEAKGGDPVLVAPLVVAHLQRASGGIDPAGLRQTKVVSDRRSTLPCTITNTIRIASLVATSLFILASAALLKVIHTMGSPPTRLDQNSSLCALSSA